MPAYVVPLIASISDPETYKRYVAQVEPTLAPFGGRFLARVPGPAVLEGGPAPARAIILAFPTEADARAWHASPAYEPVMALRQSASTGTLLLLPGYAGAASSQVAVGDVCYVEIVTPDPAAARAFFESAHGWRFEGPREELGRAHVATLPGGARFAVRAPMDDAETPLTRTYVRVADIEAAVKHAEALGAEVGLPPVEIPGHGRIAIYFVGGVQLGVWQTP